MYTRILVAVDGSQTSRRAFEAALALARSTGALLQPFYVVENTPLYFEAPGYDPSVLRERLIEEGKELGVKLPRGASAQVKQIARELIAKRGPGVLEAVSKTHFKTAAEVLEQA